MKEKDIYLVRLNKGETLENGCSCANSIPIMATSFNINYLVKMLKKNCIKSAGVLGWNGSRGKFVLRDNGALNPFDPKTNNTCHVFCKKKCGKACCEVNEPVCYLPSNTIKCVEKNCSYATECTSSRQTKPITTCSSVVNSSKCSNNSNSKPCPPMHHPKPCPPIHHPNPCPPIHPPEPCPPIHHPKPCPPMHHPKPCPPMHPPEPCPPIHPPKPCPPIHNPEPCPPIHHPTLYPYFPCHNTSLNRQEELLIHSTPNYKLHPCNIPPCIPSPHYSHQQSINNTCLSEENIEHRLIKSIEDLCKHPSQNSLLLILLLIFLCYKQGGCFNSNIMNILKVLVSTLMSSNGVLDNGSLCKSFKGLIN